MSIVHSILITFCIEPTLGSWAQSFALGHLVETDHLVGSSRASEHFSSSQDLLVLTAIRMRSLILKKLSDTQEVDKGAKYNSSEKSHQGTEVKDHIDNNSTYSGK